MQFEISPLAVQILNCLEENGFEGYLVGGCIRDLIMGKSPHDWDITTNALPHEIKKCFVKYQIIETGIQHGTVSIIIEKEQFEVTTYRMDGEYLDGRHPEKVLFTRNLAEDLSRRDFTINAVAYHPHKGIRDYFGGVSDIKHGFIRTVGIADKRFQEDGLRIMRGLRFSSKLGFSIEEQTAKSILKNRFLLNKISVERLSSELDQLLLGQNVEKILKEFSEVLGVFIPEIIPYITSEQKDVGCNLTTWNHTIKAIGKSKINRQIRLTLLFHDLGKTVSDLLDKSKIESHFNHAAIGEEITKKRLYQLKYDRRTIQIVSKTVAAHHHTEFNGTNKQIRHLLHQFGEEITRNLIEVKHADILAKNISEQNKILQNILFSKKILEEILKEKQCYSLKDLAVNGTDLINLGIPTGKKMGDILNQLLEMVLEDQLQNNREILLQYTEKIFCK